MIHSQQRCDHHMIPYLLAVDELTVKEEEVSLLRMSLGDLVQLSRVNQLCAHLQNIITL